MNEYENENENENENMKENMNENVGGIPRRVRRETIDEESKLQASYLFNYIMLSQVLLYWEAGAVPALLVQLTSEFELDFGGPSRRWQPRPARGRPREQRNGRCDRRGGLRR